MKGDLNKGLDKFFDQFSSTRELVDDLIQSRSHPQEILILLCSRIDALASSATREDEASGKSFTGFVRTYSGKSRLFDSVSVGDLYYELDYHLWLLPGMLEKAGRIQIFSRLNEPILKLLVDSEIALTLEEAQRLIKRMQRALRKHFRVAPNQPRRKPVEFPAKFLASLFSDCIRHYRKRLVATGKVPPNIHFEIFTDDPFSRLDLLDENLLPHGRTALPK